MTITADDIKAFRAEYLFTQSELAEAVDTTRGYLAAIERGRREPYLDLQDRLVDFFGFVSQCEAEGRL